MTRTEHLLVILCEECAEVAQRVSKSLRFSPDEIQPGQFFTNAQRIALEMEDLVATYQMLIDEELFPPLNQSSMERKKLKVERFLKLSKQQGTLS